jgi:hypothetical protein
MFDLNALRVNLILNEEILDVHVACLFGAGIAPILFDKNQTCVVLVQDKLINVNTLSIEEMCDPDQLQHYIVLYANDFGLGRAPGNQFLFGQGTID